MKELGLYVFENIKVEVNYGVKQYVAFRNVLELSMEVKKIIFVLLSISSIFSAFCQVKDESIIAIESQLKQLQKLYPRANIGFSLLNNEGKSICSKNGKVILIPASTLKIYTTCAALNLLGKDFTFKTYLEYDGYVDECGTLIGNLYIRGTGDPTLGSERIEGLLPWNELSNLFADQIEKAGIKEIKGDIIGDGTYFNDCLTPSSWLYKDRANYFGAAPSGLCINENSYKLFFKPGKSVGSKTEIIGTNPENIPKLSLKNSVTTYLRGSGDRAVIMEDSVSHLSEVIGTIPSGVSSFAIRGAIPDPPLFTAQLLYEKLTSRGFKVSGKSYSMFDPFIVKRGAYRNLIFTYYSPTLIQIIKQINFRSHNLFAETLIVTLGKQFRNIGNHETGLKVIFEYWQSKGVDLQKTEVYDGSGLSPLNRISAGSVTSMLNNIKGEPTFHQFLETLPISGESGTVRHFCANNTAKGKLYIKSGSIEEVKSYAGYARSKSGDLLPFTIFINNYRGNKAHLSASLEKLMVLITNIR